MSGIEIRAAAPGDVPVLLRLIRALADYEKLLDQVVATEDAIAAALFGQPRYAEALLARCDGEAVGFALFFHNYSTFLGRPGLYLEDLFVVPEARGRGIGRALFAQVARIAVERDCGRLEWAVLDWNQPAIEFYRRLGAQALDQWTLNRLTGAPLRALADDSRSR
ncbi:GNAT family N-acetyltransferase [Sinimarinibacterium thermocellulolyticum]|uniref:GNAT family N-acetyltransferase n=1 Tax=Sinimarinibacterium thermocellulolyticum TaxID=3170016 RepID=A0ABV2AA63_9GAMM